MVVFKVAIALIKCSDFLAAPCKIHMHGCSQKLPSKNLESTGGVEWGFRASKNHENACPKNNLILKSISRIIDF